MLKNLSKQSDHDNRISVRLLDGKVIQKALTSHKFFNKLSFSFSYFLQCKQSSHQTKLAQIPIGWPKSPSAMQCLHFWGHLYIDLFTYLRLRSSRSIWDIE